MGETAFLMRDKLLHKVIVDIEASRGVDDDPVDTLVSGFLKAVPGNIDGVGVRWFAVDGYAQLLAEGHELVDRSWALEVGGDEEGRLAVASELEGQLGGGGGLTGALETCEENDTGGHCQQDSSPWPSAPRMLVSSSWDYGEDLLGRSDGLEDFRC